MRKVLAVLIAVSLLGIAPANAATVKAGANPLNFSTEFITSNQCNGESKESGKRSQCK
jgi:hypothetical protein